MVIHKDSLTTQAVAGSWNGGTKRENYILTTTDATPTVIFAVPLNQLEGVGISAVVKGNKSDFSAGISRTLSWGARRASASNVTSEGAATGADVEDSAGTPAVTVNANTSAQQAEIKVTGIAAETWHWEISVAYTKTA